MSDISTGDVALQLSPAVQQDLTAHHVTVSVVSPAATTTNGTFDFPMTLGRIDPTLTSGKIAYAGSLLFTDDSGHHVTFSYALSDLTGGVTTGYIPELGTKAVPLYTHDSTTFNIHVGLSSLLVDGIKLTLSPQAAAAVDDAFHTTLASEQPFATGQAQISVTSPF